MLEFDGLTKQFGDKQVLNGLTFDIRPGELYGFCGANGAGKTTAMRIALGVLSADAGEVRWNGAVVDEQSRRRIGYMPEERGLYAKMRPREQLAYFAELSGMPRKQGLRRADELMERMGVKMEPKDVLDKLSLGNQQKVQLIAALIHQPDVLVLDEPFSGLDPLAVDAMASLLEEFAAAGAPVVFSSHQLDLVERLCDRVGILEGGALVAEGTVGELRRSGGSRKLQVAVSGADGAWAEQLAGVTVLEVRDDMVTLLLDDNVSTRDVIAAAQATGDLTHFAWHERTLAEIFREVVVA